jgi:CRP-like cAMP-binding protein
VLNNGCHELQAGEVGKEMYILEYGVAAVTTTVTTAAAAASTAVSAAAVKRATAAVVATLSTGDYCGEAALLSSATSSSDTIGCESDSGSSSSSNSSGVHVRTVTAKSYCDAFALAATDFAEVSTVNTRIHITVVM